MSDTGAERDNSDGVREFRDRLASVEGRRELRQSEDLNEALADELLSHEDDFSTTRFDRTLSRVVELASIDALRAHAAAVASGPAAGALWSRLRTTQRSLEEAVTTVVRDDRPAAVRSVLTWLLLDPLRGREISVQVRVRIAEALLASRDAEARGLAAEALAELNANALMERADSLVKDESERVRRSVWRAYMSEDQDEGLQMALAVLTDGQQPMPVRRSAMVAIAEWFPTAQVEGFLATLVGDPNRELALAAAHLFQSLHRSPTIAAAAVQSPHEEVREIARVLMDPYRGSPAAGGSRPGDPTGGDMFAKMLRRLGDDATDNHH